MGAKFKLIQASTLPVSDKGFFGNETTTAEIHRSTATAYA